MHSIPQQEAIGKIDVKVPFKKGGGVHINDFISEPYRWDQKIFFFILLSESDTKANFQPSADLVKFTGVSLTVIIYHTYFVPATNYFKLIS